jgi:hypothetical protein
VTWYLFGPCAVVIVLVSVRELRRDRDRLATFATVIGLLWTLVYGTATFVVATRQAAYGAVAILFGLVTVASLIRVVRTAFWKDDLPSLRSLGWTPGALTELRDVQFAVLSQAPAHGARTLRIDLQNCSQAPREVELAFTPQFEVDPTPALRGRVTLGPLHVGSLLIGLPTQLPGGSFAITPTVSGPPGARGRRWRAKPYSPPVSPAFQILAALVGHLVWGGGMTINIPSSPEGAPELATATTWKRIWPAG